MKQLYSLITSLALGLLCAACQHDSAADNQARGSSARQLDAVGPDEVLSPAEKQARLAAHLQYAEEALRRKGTRGMPGHLRRRRFQALKLLQSYRTAGVFPLDSAPTLRPCLLDQAGRPCAVGYLLQQTGQQRLLEELSRRHRHDRIESINHPELRRWVKSSGLTLDEYALIQSVDRREAD